MIDLYCFNILFLLLLLFYLICDSIEYYYRTSWYTYQRFNRELPYTLATADGAIHLKFELNKQAKL